MDTHQTDILIIGAGAVGTALGRELSRYSLDVIVADRLNDVGGDASKSNSAIVHTGFDAPHGSLESEMVVSANSMWDKICSDLDIPFSRTGAILAAITEQEEAELPFILEKARKNKVCDCDLLSAEQIRCMEPDVTDKVRAGILVPRESITDPFLFVVALAENAYANGVRFLCDCDITNLIHDGDGYIAESSFTKIRAKYVVNAAGLFSDCISALLGITDFSMHPRRGQFHILDRSTPLTVKRIILPVPTKITKGKILAPTIHGNWLIGPTAEDLDDKTDTGTTEDGLAEVIKGVRKLVPAIDSRQAITQYAGLRPVRDPGGYFVRHFDHCPGYLEISGIRSTGLSSSLALAKYACHQLADMGVILELKKEFVSQRKGIPCFRDTDKENRQKLINKDPRFGRVICRCETVTEAEIVQAIHRQPGARDIDGVKRRVRAGLGRCQGGFCGMRIPGILARELKIPMTEVSKKGSGSELLSCGTKELRDN